MANRNWEDPYDVAEFAREDGPEGLMRLADYFETTGQPIPTTVKTALLTSRGPGVFPIQGIFPSKRPNTRAAAETVPEALRPTDTLTAQEPSPESIAEYNYVEKNPDSSITPEGVFNQKTGQRLGDSVKQILALRSTPPAAPSPNTTTPKAPPASRPAIQRKAPSVTEQLGPVPSYTLEDAPDAGVNLYNRPPTNYDLSVGDVEKEAKGFGITPQEMNDWLAENRILAARDTAAERKMAARKLVSGELASPIPVASAPVKADVPGAVAGTIAPTTSTSPAPPAGTSSTVKPPPVEAGSGGDDEMGRLSMGQALVRALEGSGSVISGQNLRSGAADTLGERMKQIEALRAKKAERQEGLDIERSQNNQTLEYYKRLFPDKAEDLEASLRDATGKGQVFRQGLDAWLKREEFQNVKKPTADARIASMGVGDQVKLDTLDLKRDIAKDNRDYRAVQAGLQKAALDLRRAENERKAVGGTEPSTKERGAFQTMMKPAENTAVALKDADNLNTLSSGMLISGKPPPFLTQADIVSFVGIPPFEGAMRSRLATSNPQAFDLLTQMARLKTMVGHEYFGSALSPAEAERQRQFLDFGVTDTPESISRKMKSYHDTLADRATVFLRPRVMNSPLGAEWAQASGLDAITGEGGTFSGLLAAPKAVAPKAPVAKVPAAPAPAGGVERVIMLNPQGESRAVRSDQVEKAMGQGWRMP